MTDDFLSQFRKDPPDDFVNDLWRKLNTQDIQDSMTNQNHLNPSLAPLATMPKTKRPRRNILTLVASLLLVILVGSVVLLANRPALPDTPLAEGIPIPQNLEPIRIDNIHEATELVSFGDGSLQRMAWSPDGTTIAVGATKGLLIYDTDLTLLRDFALPHGVSALDYSQDGQWLVIGDRLGQLTLYDAESYSFVNTVLAHGDLVRELAITPDDTQVFSCGFDGTLQGWDISASGLSALAIPIEESDSACQYGIAIAQTDAVEADYAIFTTYEGSLHVYVEERGEETAIVRRQIFDDLADELYQLSLRTDHQVMSLDSASSNFFLNVDALVSGDDDPVIKIRYGQEWLGDFQAEGDSILIMNQRTFTPDYTLFDPVVQQTTHIKFDVPDDLSGGFIMDYMLSPDNTMLCIVHSGKVTLWELQLDADNVLQATQRATDTPVMGWLIDVKTSPVADIALAYTHSRLYMLNIQTGEVINSISRLDTIRSNETVFSPDGQWVVTVGGWRSEESFTYTVSLWLVEALLTNADPTPLIEFDLTNGFPYEIIFTPDNQRLLMTTSNYLYSWVLDEAGDWQEDDEFVETFDNNIRFSNSSMAFDADGTLMVALSSAGHPHIYDWQTQERIWLNYSASEHRENDDSPLSRFVTFMQDGQYVLAVSEGGSVLIWEVEAEELLYKYENDYPFIHEAIYREDTQTLFIHGAGEEALFVLDLSDVEDIPDPIWNEDIAIRWSFDLSHDSKRFITVAEDSTVKVYGMRE